MPYPLAIADKFIETCEFLFFNWFNPGINFSSLTIEQGTGDFADSVIVRNGTEYLLVPNYLYTYW